MSNFCTQCGKALQDGEVCACQQVEQAGQQVEKQAEKVEQQVEQPADQGAKSEEPKTDYAPMDFIPEPVQPVPDESVPVQPVPVQPPIQPMMGAGMGQPGSNNFNQGPIPPVAPPMYNVPKPVLPSYDVNAFAILSVIMGIVGLCTDSGLGLGILAIIFSQIAKKRLRKEDLLGEKFTKAGLIMGIVAIVFVVIGLITGAALLGSFVYNIRDAFRY